MKGMKGPIKAMTKSAIARAIAKELEMKYTVVAKIMCSIAEICTKEMTSTGKFVIPGLVMLKTRVKPATRVCKKGVFGKMCEVKGRPPRTIVEAYPRVKAMPNPMQIQLHYQQLEIRRLKKENKQYKQRLLAFVELAQKQRQQRLLELSDNSSL